MSEHMQGEIQALREHAKGLQALLDRQQSVLEALITGPAAEQDPQAFLDDLKEKARAALER